MARSVAVSHGRTCRQNSGRLPRSISQTFAPRVVLPIPANPETTTIGFSSTPRNTASSSAPRPWKRDTLGASWVKSAKGVASTSTLWATAPIEFASSRSCNSEEPRRSSWYTFARGIGVVSPVLFLNGTSSLSNDALRPATCCRPLGVRKYTFRRRA